MKRLRTEDNTDNILFLVPHPRDSSAVVLESPETISGEVGLARSLSILLALPSPLSSVEILASKLLSCPVCDDLLRSCALISFLCHVKSYYGLHFSVRTLFYLEL